MVLHTRADSGGPCAIRADRRLRSLCPRHFGFAHHVALQIRRCRRAFSLLDDALPFTFVRSRAPGISPGHSPDCRLKVTSSPTSARPPTGAISDSSLFFVDLPPFLLSKESFA